MVKPIDPMPPPPQPSDLPAKATAPLPINTTPAPPLLPCPFCGGPAHRAPIDEGSDLGAIGCASDCALAPYLTYDERTEGRAVAAWNRRAPAPSADAAVDAETLDAEQARWQRGIEEVLAKYGPVPDAGGCDSGDPLDYTLSQLDMFLGVEREAAAEREALAGAGLIAAERRRQVEAEGWTPSHDDEHDDGAIAAAAAVYALTDWQWSVLREHNINSDCLFPVEWQHKPKDRLRDLVRAGALIAAEIDRLQRADAARSKGGAPC